MIGILSKLLQKRGIKSIEELSGEEKVTFESYEKTLSEGEITIDGLKKFLTNQIEIIEGKWRDYESKNKENLIPYHTTYKAILQAIDAPQEKRRNLENYLNSLLNN